MSYASLWGNTTAFSGYGVEESGSFLQPGASTTSVGQTGFSVNTTQSSGAIIHGLLRCSYDFSKTPEKTSCKYQVTTGISANFNIVMITSGDYLSSDSSTSLTAQKGTTERATTQSGLVSLGTYTGIRFGPSANASRWRDSLKVDWSDYGNAAVLYGKMSFDSNTYYGVVVQFPQNVAAVDPSIVQTKWAYACTATTSYTVSFTSNPTDGDAIIVGVYCYSNAWNACSAGLVTSVGETGVTISLVNDVDVLSGGFVQWIYAGSPCSGCGSTVTVTTNWNSNRWSISIVLYEVSGINAAVYVTATGRCDASCGYEPVTINTASTSFSYSTYFAVAIGGGWDGVQYSQCSAGSSSFTEDSGGCLEYSTTVSPPTTFPTRVAGGGTLYPYTSTVGAVFAGIVTQPITAALSTVYGGSTQAVTVSGCSPSPSTLPGDGGSHNIVMLSGCAYSLTLPTGYQWTTSSSSTSCSSSPCGNFPATYEQSPVTQPIKAILRSGGQTQNVYVSGGCNANRTFFAGDGANHGILASPSCSLILTVLSPYVWETTGGGTLIVQTCGPGTGTCPLKIPSYMAYVQPVNNPSNPSQSFYYSYVNLTGSLSSVYVNLFNSPYNYLFGSSCGSPPCASNSGLFSHQFNVVFPNYVVRNVSNTFVYCGTSSSRNDTLGCLPFMMQAVIEFQSGGTCNARPQGAPSSPPAQGVTPYSFPCSNITAPGNSFQWIVDSTSGNFVDIKLNLNGGWVSTWTTSQIFTATGWPGSVSTANWYGQSVFAGSYSPNLFGNLLGGRGFISYAGVYPFNCHMLNPTNCPSRLTITAEYSNFHATNVTGSGTNWNETYLAGAFTSSLVAYGGSVSSQDNILGMPDGLVATINPSSTGGYGYVKGSFGGKYNGTVTVCGFSSGGGSSQVTVKVSSSNTVGSWTTLYSKPWGSTAMNGHSCMPMGSVTKMQYVTFIENYTSGAGVIVNIDAIGIAMGSYAQANQSCTPTGGGQVLLPGNIVGLNDSYTAELKALSSGDIACVTADFGIRYSGYIVLDLTSGSGFSSLVSIAVSLDGVNFTPIGFPLTCSSSANCPSSSPQWRVTFLTNSARYVKVSVSYSAGAPSDLFLDAIYLA